MPAEMVRVWRSGWIRAFFLLSALRAFLAGAPFALAASAGETLDPFAGSWRGGGTMTLADGRSERVRCSVNVRSKGPSYATQSMKCASTGHDISVGSNMVLEGGRISGSWHNNKGESGGLSGSLRGNALNVILGGAKVSASVVSSVSKCNLSVKLNGRMGSITRISVRLKKGC
jgi:hypothetical protein